MCPHLVLHLHAIFPLHRKKLKHMKNTSHCVSDTLHVLLHITASWFFTKLSLYAVRMVCSQMKKEKKEKIKKIKEHTLECFQ